MTRVATLEHIAAEEGAALRAPLSGRPQAYPSSPAPSFLAARNAGWAAPTAETIGALMSSAFQDETARLRQAYFEHASRRLGAARDQLDHSVSSLVSSTTSRGPPLLPTTAAAPPPVARSTTSYGSLDAACAAV